MPIIEVKKPFKIRLKDNEPLRKFSAGRHEVTAEELDNWFIRDCIAAGDILAPVQMDEAAGEPQPEDTETEMLAAFDKLTKEDLKTDGTPKVKAVENLLGKNVTAEQVSAAWARYQEGGE